MGSLGRRKTLLFALAVWVAPLSGVAAPSGWAKIKRAKGQEPAKVSATPAPAPAPPNATARGGSRSKAKSYGPAVSGKVAVFGFTGDGAARVQQVVVSTLRTRGLQVTTSLRPVDSAEQFREMGTMLQLAAYIEGTVGGNGSQATVHVRSGVTGRRIASIRFSGDRAGLAADVSNKLWPKTGSKLARLCQEAAKPRKQRGGGPMRIDAGTPLEAARQDDADVPRHLRTGKRRDDPWAADDGK
jgi:hypothetical protein